MIELRGAALLSAAVALVLTSMVGCTPPGTVEGADGTTGVPAPGTSQAGSSSPAPGTAAPGTTTPQAAASRTTAPRTPGAAPNVPAPAGRQVTAPACTSAQLQASASNASYLFPDQHPRVDPALADTQNGVTLVNTSRSACSLDGWAGLGLYGENVASVCNQGVCPTIDTTSPRNATVNHFPGAAATPVLLQPGQQAWYQLLYRSSGTGSCANQLWMEPYSAKIWIPGDRSPLALSPVPDLHPCNGQILITPINVGSSY